jgi:hypothetical protein
LDYELSYKTSGIGLDLEAATQNHPAFLAERFVYDESIRPYTAEELSSPERRKKIQQIKARIQNGTFQLDVQACAMKILAKILFGFPS